MEIENLSDLIIPILLISTGLFIKNTKNINFQSSKKFWKILVILGIINLLLKLVFIIFF